MNLENYATNMTVSHLGGGKRQLGSCSILELDIGAIFIDLLGLQISLAPIALDIVAQRGAGNLLGNLLCAIAGLLGNSFLMHTHTLVILLCYRWLPLNALLHFFWV